MIVAGAGPPKRKKDETTLQVKEAIIVITVKIPVKATLQVSQVRMKKDDES